MKKLLLILTVVIFLLAGCEDSSGSGIVSGSNITPMPSSKKENETNQGIVMESDGTITAVLLTVDSDKKTIVVRALDEGTDYQLYYTGATNVRNSYDEVISMRQLSSGEIVDIEYDTQKLKANSVTVSGKAFKTSGITNFKADHTTDTISIGAGKYKYDEFLVVTSQGNLIELAQVINKDEVTVWGIDNKIYSVCVDKGHGYVTFTGYQQFVGGMVEIGRSFLYRVSDNMMITIPEGEYKITMTNGELTGSKTINVGRDMEAVVDFSEYRADVVKTGTVVFEVSPADTALYINGKKTDHKNPVELDYGKYSIRAVCEGYDEYTSTVVVDSLYITKKIQLDNGMESTTESKTDAVLSTESSDGKDNGNTNETAGYPTETIEDIEQAEGSGEGNLIIETPVGADVYIDAVYMGQTPLTIKKDPGEHIITFHKNGYATKSYAIDVSYEDADQKLSFPEMNEE